MYQPQSALDVPMAVRTLSYTVRRGDTLPVIAARYKVSTDDLRRWNAIGRLAAGQRLVIQVKQSAPQKSAKPAKKKYSTRARK